MSLSLSIHAKPLNEPGRLADLWPLWKKGHAECGKQFRRRRPCIALLTFCVVLIRSWCSSRRAEPSTGYRPPGWWSEPATSSRSTQPTRLEKSDTHALLVVHVAIVLPSVQCLSHCESDPDLTQSVLSVAPPGGEQPRDSGPGKRPSHRQDRLWTCLVPVLWKLRLLEADRGQTWGRLRIHCQGVWDCSNEMCVFPGRRAKRHPDSRVLELWSDFTHVFGTFPRLASVSPTAASLLRCCQRSRRGWCCETHTYIPSLALI